jgi:hypothetical protein
MSRWIKLIAAVAIIAGAMIFFAGRSGDQPMTKQEQAVDLDALG